MIEGLEYHFRKDTRRGTPVSVTGPKSLIDEATSRVGPLLSEVKALSKYKFLGRQYDGQGNITLDFDLNTNGMQYYSGPINIRSLKTLEVIAQLDAFAQRKDAGDPRIAIDLSPVEHSYAHNYQNQREEERFGISFEKPEGAIDDVAAKIQNGIIHAAGVLCLYEAHRHSFVNITCASYGEEGIEVKTGAFYAKDTIVAADSTASGNRINLMGTRGRTPQERLAVLAGVISALDPIKP